MPEATKAIAYRVPPYLVWELTFDGCPILEVEPTPDGKWELLTCGNHANGHKGDWEFNGIEWETFIAEPPTEWRVQCETCEGGSGKLPKFAASSVAELGDWDDCPDCEASGIVSIPIGKVELKQAAHFPPMPQSLIDSILDSSSIADDDLHLAWLCVAREVKK